MASTFPPVLFNAEWYLNQNPDIAEAVRQGLITAEEHFQQFGNAEGRASSPLFNPEDYLAANPDVAEAVAAGIMSATEHFLLFGQGEPRQINPFINLGTYLDANDDLGAAYMGGGISPFVHLLTYGAEEGRDLGNGINLGIFANDSIYQAAILGGNLQAALERMEEVAPFLPSFEPPANWQPAPNTPIPTNFTPPPGTTLVIPPSVVVPEGTELPPGFAPVEPPAPTPPGGGGVGVVAVLRHRSSSPTAVSKPISRMPLPGLYNSARSRVAVPS